MPSADYFRRQAEICVRLSALAKDKELSSRLMLMAKDYMGKAVAAAARPNSQGRKGPPLQMEKRPRVILNERSVDHLRLAVAQEGL